MKQKKPCNWQRIRARLQQGDPLAALAGEYRVSAETIARKALEEQWDAGIDDAGLAQAGASLKELAVQVQRLALVSASQMMARFNREVDGIEFYPDAERPIHSLYKMLAQEMLKHALKQKELADESSEAAATVRITGFDPLQL